MYRKDILAHAYALAKSNQGVDGQSFQGIESQGLEEWLNGVREERFFLTGAKAAHSAKWSRGPYCNGPWKASIARDKPQDNPTL
ncbi:MAG TPA: hypothetical protein VMB85_06510 [Bryobacteraceae bacterium]|jgi:hypothetical protein|nr:hypothetical protein [Bryobacteraceae bacterium]